MMVMMMTLMCLELKAYVKAVQGYDYSFNFNGVDFEKRSPADITECMTSKSSGKKAEFLNISKTLLSPNEPFKDGDTLVSSDEMFELGFNIGMLQMNSSGILQLISDANTNTTIWSSSFESVTSVTSVAQLLDNGNFVIRDENRSNEESFIWQSVLPRGAERVPKLVVATGPKIRLWRIIMIITVVMIIGVSSADGMVLC
uniref:G-type lectin S-receptor-like serine/threonine-protein kinase At4g27290 n=1 Tax=Tanacetum cinerariifolium TaxID=118510 RepID=A0A699J2M5_TANCI|nr:G-type lectin S-receptor-like serine/threonine-protein kinase At4g27290 [Tanacetum cinerariifolium]